MGGCCTLSVEVCMLSPLLLVVVVVMQGELALPSSAVGEFITWSPEPLASLCSRMVLRQAILLLLLLPAGGLGKFAIVREIAMVDAFLEGRTCPPAPRRGGFVR